MHSKTWYKAIDNNLDRKDVELLNLLVKDKELDNEELQELSKELKISEAEISERIKKLQDKKILLKTNSAVVNSIKIWNDYLYVLIKATLHPPVVGLEIDFPTGWSDMMQRILKIQKELQVDMIRSAHALHGIGGYDIMLVVTFNDTDEFLKLVEDLNKEGWITKAESFSPNQFNDLYIFDPIAVPTPEDFDKQVTNQIKEVTEK